jgi:hypothetical protein
MTIPLRGRAARLTLACVLAATAAGAAACTSSARHGRSQLQAEYTGRKLTVVLPADVTVAQAAAAAESALLAGGYVLSERTVVSDRARLVGAAPVRAGLGPNPRPVVAIRPIASGTEATVTLEPFGDEEVSRRILDDMLVRLGL